MAFPIGSGPTYETRRWVDGAGTGMGDAFFRDDVGKETRLFEPFIYKNAHFTKTGSGQT